MAKNILSIIALSLATFVASGHAAAQSAGKPSAQTVPQSVAQSKNQTPASQASNILTLNVWCASGTPGDTVMVSHNDGILGGKVIGYYPFDSKRSFSLNTPIEGAQLLVLHMLKNGQTFAYYPIAVEAGNIDLKIHSNGAMSWSGVERPNLVWNQVTDGVDGELAKAREQIYNYINANRSTMTREQFLPYQQKLDSLMNLSMQNVYNQIVNHPEENISDLLFDFFVERFSMPYRIQMEKALEAADAPKPHFKRYLQKLEFADFMLPDADGKYVKASDIVKANKVTLIDFWASWCGPCRMEMPHVKEAYEAFHAQGFEIIGVSLDNNRQSWLNSIKSIGMPWIHLSDLKGWQCSVAGLYGVRSIPSSALVDQNGRIIARDLRGPALKSALEQFFASQH